MKPPIIVYGPPACGKTRWRYDIARGFGLRSVVDEADEHVLRRCEPDTLYLTNLAGMALDTVAPRVMKVAFDDIRIRYRDKGGETSIVDAIEAGIEPQFRSAA